MSSRSGVTFWWFEATVALSAVLALVDAGERAKLSSELRRISKLETGLLIAHDIPTEEEIDSMDVEDLRPEIKAVYERLQCSYVLIALRHMLLTRAVLKTPDRLPTEVLFDEEAASMLATALNEPGLTPITHTLWAFWLYANRTRRHLEAGNPHYPATWSIHRAVDSLLKTFLATNPCRYCDLPDQLLYLKILETEVAKQRIKVADVIARNRSLLAKQLKFNHEYGISTDGQQWISTESITLNGLGAFETMVKTYLGTVYWDAVRATVGDLYDQAMNLGVTLTTQVEYLLAYQNVFMITPKVILLLLVRQYLYDTIAAQHLEPNVLQENHAKVARAIWRFTNCTANSRDLLLSQLIVFVPKCQMYGDALIKNIDNGITSALRTSRIKALVNREFPVNVEDRGGQALCGINEFVNYVGETLLDNVNMETINSFTLYAHSTPYRLVRTEERKHQEDESSGTC